MYNGCPFSVENVKSSYSALKRKKTSALLFAVNRFANPSFVAKTTWRQCPRERHVLPVPAALISGRVVRKLSHRSWLLSCRQMDAQASFEGCRLPVRLKDSNQWREFPFRSFGWGRNVRCGAGAKRVRVRVRSGCGAGADADAEWCGCGAGAKRVRVRMRSRCGL